MMNKVQVGQTIGAYTEVRSNPFEEYFNNLEQIATSESIAGSAAEEEAAQLLGRCFAMANIQGASVDVAYFPRDVLITIARELVLNGESVWIKRSGELEWVMSYEYDDGAYKVNGRSVPRNAMFHVRYLVDRVTGRGVSPLSLCINNRKLLRGTESVLANEASTGSSYPLPTPQNFSEDEAKAFITKLNEAKGKPFPVQTQAGGYGDMMNARRGSEDWQQKRIGADTPVSVSNNYQMAHMNTLSMYSMRGLSDATAGAKQEAWRFYYMTFIEPMSLLVEDAAARVNLDISLDFTKLLSFDIVGRARALVNLLQADIPVEEALVLAGLRDEDF